MKNPYISTNQELWNLWTCLNMEPGSEYLDMLARFKAGETSLQKIELEELTDVAGKSLLHLQCHFGLDTLSWARKGAEVTGVDFSEESIRLAQTLSRELDIQANFLCANIYDLPQVLDRRFDIVFTSHGVLPWLPDLDRWAEIIFEALTPGGTFYIVDGHPIRRLLLPGRADATGLPIQYGYFHKAEPVSVQEPGSYANPEIDCVHTAFYWAHGLGEIVTALSSTGLKIEFLHEFPQTVELCHSYEETNPELYKLRPQQQIEIPRMFSIMARI